MAASNPEITMKHRRELEEAFLNDLLDRGSGPNSSRAETKVFAEQLSDGVAEEQPEVGLTHDETRGERLAQNGH